MAKHIFTQCTYQQVVFNVDAKNCKDPVTVVHTFVAPPGFRLHSFHPLRDSNVIIGQPVKFVAMFENYIQVEHDVPEEQLANANGEGGNA